MKTTSRKIIASTLSPEDVERVVGELADLDAEAAKAQTNVKIAVQVLEDEIAVVRKRWQGTIDAQTSARDAILQEQAAKLAILQGWAEANKATLFSGKRRVVYLRGIVGFRQSKPALATLAKRSWTSVVEVVRKMPAMAAYLKVKYSLDKEALLRDRDKLNADGLLEQAGLRIKQVDEFYFEPKQETSDSLAA